MASGNRGFAQGLAAEAQATSVRRLPPRTDILQSRGNRLAEIAAGETVVRDHQLVDPAICRMWEGHNRDYEALNETSCADLLESLKARGRQELPAIVRRIGDDGRHKFEVVCGARRHWSVSWLRTHGCPDFKFLIEPRELSDEEAFRLADLENRSRQDLSDFERATDYLRALDRYYDGNQARMAERLGVSAAWLSRYLSLTRLPPVIHAAFGSPHRVKISHAAVLQPLLGNTAWAQSMMAEAKLLATEQSHRKEARQDAIPAAAVVDRLKQAARRPRGPAGPQRTYEVRSDSGDLVAKGQRSPRGGGVSIAIPKAAKHGRVAVLDAISEILQEICGFPDADDKGTQHASRSNRDETTH